MGTQVDPGIGNGPARVRGDQWHLDYLRVPAAHRLSEGQGVVVAVPDTGVEPHPDLRRNLLAGEDVIPGGTGNGQSDTNSHGTGMAGLIAAHGQPKNLGALGVAPLAKILPILDTPPDGLGQPDDLAASIEFAVARHADIISVSAASMPTPRLQAAVRAAVQANIIVVAAAGNSPRESVVSYPASEPGVVAVGGVDRTGNHADFSVSGPEVDVVAPAVDIYSTSTNGRYRRSSGTSDATAIVAGAAALIRSKYPNLPAVEVAHRLTATAVDKGPPGRDDQYGYGVIDLVAALTADVPPLGFESTGVTAPAPTAAAPDAGGDNSTARGLATLSALLAAGGAYLVWRRRRRADDPPPRISR
ncbi:S8 family serine peptidase [Micromonospora sp. WMMA1998]|uniref:S8 family serine peptidase n=1 Tax=Micromonospora sp. WMMA1998 TaxID=3015167 RepID=UPI00248B0F67|nr:S8 family serine peptidase [Micromonospora sp. WMMA1998]WBC18182.1 S8 family serine peptidase [Micromonospora sp. WMMA1998]